MENNTFIEAITAQFQDEIYHVSEPYGMITMEVNPEKIIDILRWLKEHPTLKMSFLTDLTGIHYPENKGKEIGVIYHLHSLVNNVRLRLKCFLPIEKPDIESATAVYLGANWMERETYDFFGIIFKNHPDLRRILNVDEMEYFPMRKEYPLEDQLRTDKEDKYFGR